MLMMLLQIHNIVTHCRKFKNESHFFHFLCNRLIIRDAFLCFFYTVGLIHDVFITCYFTAYKVTTFLGYNQKNSEKITFFSLVDAPLALLFRV